METFYSGPLQSTGWRATEAMDEAVHNVQKDRIGEVKDLLIDGDGRVRRDYRCRRLPGHGRA